MRNNVGVFSYKSPVLKYRPVNEQEAVSWSNVFMAIVITLLIVAGASSVFNTLQSKMVGSNRSTTMEDTLLKVVGAITMVNIAEAATVSNTLDRSATYQKNANLYKPVPVVKKAVPTKKATVKVALPVKSTKKTVVKAVPVAKVKTVTNKAAVVASVTTKTPAVAQLTALRMIQTSGAVTMAANDRMTFEVGFKNTSNDTWKATDNVKLNSTAKYESYFHDKTWDAKNIAVSLKSDVKPGEIGYFKFVLGAPVKAGTYTEALYLTQNGKKIAGGELSLPIQVVNAAPKSQLAVATTTTKPLDVVVPQKPLKEATVASSSTVANDVIVPAPSTGTTTQSQTGVITNIQTTEQIVRVGLFVAADPTQITANTDYLVKDGEGTIISTEKAGTVTTVTFDPSTKQYSVVTPTVTTTVTSYVRFTGTGSASPDNDTIFEIPSYINHPGWNSKLNDNKFRAVLEVRYAAKTNKVWIINELYLEQYLKGLAETSNGSPYEYQKALVTAARTYAQYHINRNTKYLGENFTVRSTDADQVYRGYGSESRMPNLVKALNDTRGVIVTYQGKLAITPYFSQSDGRTRTWTEVWGGSGYPWLIGVADPAGEGLPMLGHGVGMSARGALSMAADGKNFEEILKHYYTGVDLTKIFN